MATETNISIVIGRVELFRVSNKANEQTKATAKGVVFKDCPSSMECDLVLNRALRALPSVKSLKGWKVVALHPVKHLGYSLNNELDTKGE